METVTIQKLSKTYPSGKEALKQLSLTLSTGEVFGFLGPNGAGKTTTVKLLTGVLSPSGGSCEIMGVNPNIQPEKVHLLAGIVTEHAQMYDNLTGIENLMFYAAAFGMEQKGKWRAESLLKELEFVKCGINEFETQIQDKKEIPYLVRKIVEAGEDIYSVNLIEPTLEDIYFTLTAGRKED